MSTPTYKTVEEAQAKILELQQQVTELTNERDTLSQNNETLKQEKESLRTLNQKYFNQLSAQFQDQEDENNDDDKEIQSCEEFAKTLNIF